MKRSAGNPLDGTVPATLRTKGALAADVDVVVVGAGLAGLTAARCLVAAGERVLVLEAQARVGGRLLDPRLGRRRRVSLGGQWIGAGQTRIRALCRELGLATFPSYSEGDHLLRFGGDCLRVSSRHSAAASLPCWVRPEIRTVAERLERMSLEIPLEAPYAHPHASSWDRQSLAQWLDSQTEDPAVRGYFRLETRGIFAAEADEVSLLHVLFHFGSGGGFASLVSTAGGAQQDCVVGGAQAIAERMAAQLGDRLRLSSPVRRIEQSALRVRITTDRCTVTAGRVIVAVPPAVAGRLVYRPTLPPARAALHARLPVGSVVKVALLYPEPFWRRDGLSGQVFSSRGPLHTTYDASPPEGDGVLVGFIEGRDSRRLSALAARERMRAVTDDLIAYFGSAARGYRCYLDKSWSRDAWAAGGYGAYFGPGQWTDFGPALRTPTGRIHWAGSETASVWNGYMEGAVRSGERAARESVSRERAAGTPAAPSGRGRLEPP